MKPLAKAYLSAVLVLFPGLWAVGQTYAQPGAPLWTNRYNGGGPTYANPKAIATDKSGNVFVTGYVGNNPYHFATVAYSPTGTPAWTNSWSSQGVQSVDQATAMAVDTNGNVFVTGHTSTSSTLAPDYVTLAYSGTGSLLWNNGFSGTNNGPDFPAAIAAGPGGKVFVTGSSSNITTRSDYLTIAYSTAGARLWTNRYNGPGNGDDIAAAMAVSANGRVFVTGRSKNTGSGYDYATIAYSASGALLWANFYDGPSSGDDYARAIAADANGNVFVTGYSTNTVGGYDYATVGYSNTGVPLWTNRYNGPANGNDYAQALVVDGSGNVFVTGYSLGVGSGNDYATLAYSGAGLPLWTNRYNGGSDDYAVALGVDFEGNIFVTGYSTGTANYDYLTVAYSNAGSLLWSNRFNGPANDNDFATALAVDGSGNVIVTGYSWTSGGGYSYYDYATIKYSSSIRAYLAIESLGNQVVLRWTNASFHLQSAPAMSSSFTDVLGATSPYTNLLTHSNEYFRLRH